MSAWWRRYGGRLDVEAVLVVVVGVAAFVLAALLSAAARSHVPAVLLGAFFLLAILGVARFGGVLYAVPVGVVTIEAFDWYFLPPTRSLTRPDAAGLSVLGLFIVMSVLVGVVAGRAGRRAAASEGARGVLADEQAALRRVATLVARQPSPEEVFAAVTEEAGRLLDVDIAQMLVCDGDGGGTATVVGAWSLRGASVPVGTRLSLEGDSIAARVFHTHRPARLDDFADASGSTAEYVRLFGVRAAVGTPIVVEGRFWGLMIAASRRPQALPAGTESRIEAFTELVATAISNAEARRELERVAAEQAALGRVATLVAEAVPSTEIFAAVAVEAAGLFGVPAVGLFRYEPDLTATVIAAAGDFSPYLGRTFTFPPGGPSVLASLLRTGRPARRGDYAEVEGTGAEAVDELGLGEIIGAPVMLDGRVWGAVMVGLANGCPPLPENTFERLTAFTELIATAIADAEARTEVGRLAEEQAALRRVATLVARGVQPGEMFAAVAEEIGAVLGVGTSILRYEADATATVLATWGDDATLWSVGSNWTLEGESVSARVFRTGRAARMDGYGEAVGEIAAVARRHGRRSTVGAPIVIDDRLWGAAISGSASGSLPTSAEGRIASFTELIGIAISNTEFRDGLRRLADEQTALRRVATLVAEGATAADLFSAVAREVAQVLDVPTVSLDRYESNATTTVVGAWGESGFTVGSRWPLEGRSVAAMVFASGHPARMDDYSELPGTIAAAVRRGPMISTVGVPIVVDGKVWGLICVGESRPELLPADTEARLSRFTELVATAVSNATTRAELTASRARVVAAADQTRRRIERDLHDGIQQRLVSLAFRARAAETMAPRPSNEIRGELSGIADGLGAALDELREISRGIHPAILSKGGLGPALRALARRSAVPIALDLNLGSRLEEPLEVAAYYIASEAMTNAVKHAQASVIELHVDCRDAALTLSIRDDGIGGADPSRGSGIIGLTDRVEALGGTITVVSPAGDGTTLHVRLPVGPSAASAAPSLEPLSLTKIRE